MLALTETPKTRNELEALDRIIKNLQTPPKEKLVPIQDAVRDGFGENFETESTAGSHWQQLAPATIADRLAHGYGGEHPILKRSGDYMSSFVNPVSADHVSEIEQALGITRLFEGSQDYRVPFHEVGGAIIPQRAVLAMSTAAKMRINSAIQGMVEEILNGR